MTPCNLFVSFGGEYHVRESIYLHSLSSICMFLASAIYT